MTYRDDREALRSEVDSLNEELARARADQERLRDVETRLAAARRELDALEGEVAQTRKKKPNAPAAGVVIAAISLAGVVAGVIVALRAAAPPRPPPIVVVTPPAVPTPVIPLATAPVIVPPDYAPEPAPKRVAHATWNARVTRAQGVAIAGGRCAVDASVVPDANGMHVTDVVVRCGDKVIYDEKGHLNGMSMLDSDARERPGPRAGTFVYQIVFSDAGQRSATRNQAKLDSAQRIGKVWSDNLPEIHVDLALDADSAPVAGESILGPSGDKPTPSARDTFDR